MNELYKTVLLDHFHYPRFKGSMDEHYITRRGSNPRCGDEVEVGLCIGGDESAGLQVRFRGRGCSVCLASASILATCCNEQDRATINQLCASTLAWLQNRSENSPTQEDILALDAVRKHPARAKCVLLAWQALEGVLSELDARESSKPEI